jgi:hypothetical protein
MTRGGPRPSVVARELAAFVRPGPGPLGDPDVGWGALLDAASAHRLLPAVWRALRGRGMADLPPRLIRPDSPLAIVRDAYGSNAARVADLRCQLNDVLRVLGGAGIAALPIKGAHWMVAGLHPHLAARVTIDLDIVVPAEQASAAQRALCDRGYRPAPGPAGDEPADHHLEPLYAPGRLGSIELHREPMVAFRRPLISADELWAGASTVVADGNATQVPSATHLIVLLIGHALLQDDGARLLEIPLRALHDLALLGERAVARADWAAVGAHFDRVGPGGRIALAGFGAAASDLFGIELPVAARGGRAWLRAADVALDHPEAAGRFRRAVYLPRALRRERMARLYGAASGAEVWRARARHVLTRRRRLLSNHHEE